MTSASGDHGPEPVAAEPAVPVVAPARTVVADHGWSERDRRRPDDDGALVPQDRYPGRIATP
jgi:hypothetical protein